MNCTYCENEIPAGVRNCPSCGAVVPQNQHTSAPPLVNNVQTPPNVAPYVAPNVNPYVAPNVAPYGAPNVNPYVAPNVNPYVAPNVNPYGAPNVNPYGYQVVAAKSRTTFVLLAIFFGALGIHNFYIGKSIRGSFQLLLLCISGFMAGPFVYLWAIIEAITVKVDAKGQPLS